MRSNWSWLVIGLTLLATAPGCRSSAPLAKGRGAPVRPVPPEGHFETARRLFYKAADGDREALRLCLQALTRCAGQEADAAKWLAYRGGCEMLEAARAPMPWDKGRRARRGLTMLDDAVARGPDDLEVRFVRGMTSYHLPTFMGRSGVAVADLSSVAGEAEAAVEAGRLDVPLATAALYHYGVMLAESGKAPAARVAWRQAVSLDPTTRGGKASADRLMR